MAATVEHVTLPNGLSILVVEAPTSDICGVHIALDIGPDRVPAKKAGLRALTQQVLLSRIRSVMNERDDLAPLRRQGTQGAGFSVETQREHVEFIASVTSSQFSTLAKFIGPAIFEADWTQDDVVNARELLGRQSDGDAGQAGTPLEEAFQLFYRALLGESPYASPIFGTESTRQSITLADVKSFYRSYYVPNLASICVVGPVKATEAVDTLKTVFGGYARRDVRPRSAAPEPIGETRVEIGLSPELRSSILIVGVPLPPPGSEGFVIGEVIHAALSGSNGALASNEVLSGPLALSDGRGGRKVNPAGVLPIPISRAPYLAVVIRTMPVSIEDARQAALQQLLEFAREPLSDEALKRAKTRAINLHVRPMGLSAVAATGLNRRFLITDSFAPDDGFAARVAAITPQEIQDFASAQFKAHAISVLMPGI